MKVCSHRNGEKGGKFVVVRFLHAQTGQWRYFLHNVTFDGKPTGEVVWPNRAEER